MNKSRFIRLILILVLVLAPQSSKAQGLLSRLLKSQLNKYMHPADQQRLLRLRPIIPFDENPIYPLFNVPSQDLNQPRGEQALWLDFLLGPNFQLSPQLTLSLDGLVFMLPNYNKVDGIWIGYEGILQYRISKGESLIFRSSHNFTCKSHDYFTDQKLYYYFQPKHDGFALLSAGRTSQESMPETKTEIYTNKYLHPIGLNNSRLDLIKNYVSLRHSYAVIPNLHYSLSALYQYEENRFLPNRSRHASSLQAEISYDFAPFLAYKHYFPSATQLPYGYGSLSLGLSAREEFLWGDNNLAIETGTQRRLLLEMTLRSAWADDIFLHRLDGFIGGFVQQNLGLDGRAFRRASLCSPQPIVNAWSTLPLDFSLDRQWFGLYYTGLSSKLLLSSTILGYGGLGFDEGLHVKMLSSAFPVSKYYAEIGYSIGWDQLARIGFFLGSDFKHKKVNWAFSINIPIANLLSKWGERY